MRLFTRRAARWTVLAAVAGLPLMGCRSTSPQSGSAAAAENWGVPRILFGVQRFNFNAKPSGIIMVVWEDGVVVFAQDSELPEEELLTGVITQSQLRETMAAVELAGFFRNHPEQGLAPCQSHTMISARSGNQLRTRVWDEWAKPGFEMNVTRSSEFRAFVDMWMMTKNAIYFAAPANAAPIENSPAIKKRFEADETRKTLLGMR